MSETAYGLSIDFGSLDSKTVQAGFLVSGEEIKQVMELRARDDCTIPPEQWTREEDGSCHALIAEKVVHVQLWRSLDRLQIVRAIVLHEDGSIWSVSAPGELEHSSHIGEGCILLLELVGDHATLGPVRAVATMKLAEGILSKPCYIAMQDRSGGGVAYEPGDIPF